MASTKHQDSPFEFSGGKPCLDFVNTVSWRPKSDSVEHLRDYGDWLTWTRQAGLLTPTQARSLTREALERPDQAQAALLQARGVREALYALFSAAAANDPPPPAALATLNRALVDAMAQPRLTASSGRFTWQWTGSNALLSPVWPVVRSAAELLTSTEELGRVRECAAEDCGWLFLDTSRNRIRRWCDMRVCGNRNKARRYYQRQRA